MLLDIPVKSVSLEGLQEHAAALRVHALPVGSVEYVREAMRLAQVLEPPNLSYPEPLAHLLRRRVERRRAGDVIGRWFVKPVRTKAFTGFVFDTMQDPDTLCEHDREQHAAFMELPADEPVWISEPVKFLCEWRYYVHDGRIVGQARYDPDGADDAPLPDRDLVVGAVSAMLDVPSSHTFAIDMGVLDSGETALVECNDAWALGLYGRGLDSKAYLQMLWSRWQELASAQRDVDIMKSGGNCDADDGGRSWGRRT
jgi:hypothetical protein